MKGNGEGKLFFTARRKSNGSCAYNTCLPEKYGGEVCGARTSSTRLYVACIGWREKRRGGGGSVERTFQVVGEMRLGRLGWLR